MGKRGPKPKPTTVRELEGNPGRLPINHDEPACIGVPVCPEYLSDDARAVWETIMTSVPPGMITVADAPLLTCYCEAVAQHKEASIRLREEKDLLGGRMVTRSGKPSPYLRIMEQSARTMAMLATRLGLSPADRTGIKLTNPQTKAGSKWAGLIG